MAAPGAGAAVPRHLRPALAALCCASAVAAASGGELSRCTVDLASAAGQRWRICWPDVRYGGCDAPGLGIDAVVPGTVLASMLPTNFSGIDPYVSVNLKQLPDVHDAGRAFYTVRYRTTVAAQQPGCETGNRSLVLRGINYIVNVSINGRPVAESVGMFKRVEVAAPRTAFELDILVAPPMHHGSSAKKDCGWTNCGQGGDHELAKDGPVAQFAAGWDWIQATPDRHTGLWDRVYLVEHDGPLLRDLFVRADVCAALAGGAGESTDVPLQVEASAGPLGLRWRVRGADGELAPGVEGMLGVPGSAGSGALFRGARLWAPWQHSRGDPTLHVVEVIRPDGSVLHSQSFGLRCVELYYEPLTDGPAFKVNGQRLFLAGVNWITTDQLLRFATSAKRYEDEVTLLRRAGANIIRVWGGGLAERPEFYDACDRLGVLVYQEFWMTGDNNGPQAGMYSWPLDHGVYLDSVRDTVLLLRGHPSLMWWGGGNELEPAEVCPPPEINAATRHFVETLDGSRPYVQTSSLLQQMNTYDPKNVHGALAVNDGPYSVQPPREFFVRNPALHFTLYPDRTGLTPFPLSINPEVGGPNWPTYSGVKKFITVEKAPSRLAREVPEEMDYHLFEAFNIDMTVNRLNWTNDYSRTMIDPIRDLWADNRIDLSLERYSWRANLVQYLQHRLLFEGYIQHQWTWYAGVMLWKGQTPWPSLRGFLYDWYLETNAAHAGMRAALESLDHLQVSLGPCSADGKPRLFRINRGWQLAPAAKAIVELRRLPAGDLAATWTCSAPAVEPHAVWPLVCDTASWPEPEGSFLLRLSLLSEASGAILEATENILSDPCNDQAMVTGMDWRNLDETPLGLKLQIRGPDHHGVAVVTVSNPTKAVALLVHLRLLDAASGQEILPVWWSEDYFSLLPGEERGVHWSGSFGIVEVVGFNVQPSRTAAAEQVLAV